MSCTQRRCNKRAPGSAWGGACGYKLSHDQLSSVDQQYKNCDPYKATLQKIFVETTYFLMVKTIETEVTDRNVTLA